MACAQEQSAAGGAAAPAIGKQDASTIGSYGIGLNMARDIKSSQMDFDLESFIQGLRDGVKDAKPLYTDEQLQMAVDYLQRDAKSKHEQAAKAAGDKNIREGKEFLASNKARKGVTTTASGLQYEVLKQGKGPSPASSDTVRVHYEGKLIDGTVFDSSIKRKEPIEIPVGRVIPGWVEALQLMKVGDHWKLYVPSELGYGAQGAGGVIGPNSVLIFDVELLDIVQKPAKE
jgi:FKBP-type peptidyl-prolyl cis-trans isomerase FklB